MSLLLRLLLLLLIPLLLLLLLLLATAYLSLPSGLSFFFLSETVVWFSRVAATADCYFSPRFINKFP